MPTEIITTQDLDRLLKICARLESPYDGERATAAALASRTLREWRLTWAEFLTGACRLAAPAPPPRQQQNYTDHERIDILLREADLNGWEHRFLLSLLAWRGCFTPRQRGKLDDMWSAWTTP